MKKHVISLILLFGYMSCAETSSIGEGCLARCSKYDDQMKLITAQFEMMKLENFYATMDKAVYYEYAQSLRLIGFDLSLFRKLIQAFMGSEYMTIHEIDTALLSLQQTLKPLEKIKLKKEDIERFQQNSDLIMQHLILLGKVLQDLEGVRIETGKYGYTDQHRALLQLSEDAKDIVGKIKAVDIKKLQPFKGYMKYMVTIANTAVSLSVIALPIWQKRAEIKEQYAKFQQQYAQIGGIAGAAGFVHAMDKEKIKQLFTLIDQNFNISQHVLGFLKTKGQSYMQKKIRKMRGDDVEYPIIGNQ
ncbi:hypothetical protein KBD08_01120 [Candidatus Babeliales bacterium]|nr:hypothetical protein [Candidatus Babeliales bacterium]